MSPDPITGFPFPRGVGRRGASLVRPGQTLVLGAASEIAADELRSVVDSALRCGYHAWSKQLLIVVTLAGQKA